MGPKNQYTAHPREFDESDIDRTEEYEEFIKKIQALHEKRGVTAITNLEPDIQRKKVDLLKLYKTVVDLGGYTVVSGKIGLWKELAVEFNPPQHNTNIGFVLKTIYWKNLAAYECENHWKVEAPPPDAIETQTAAGTDLVGRKAPEAVEASSPALLTRGRSGTGEATTPGATPSSSGRTLREAPPKRQFFQPDVSTPKPRNTVSMNQSPAPQTTVNGKGSTPNAMQASSTPSHANNPPLPPLRVIPVPTPYSKPQAFAPKAASRNANRPAVPNLPHGYPADGPSLMWRAVMGIASRIPSEVDFGLTSLLQRTSYVGHSISFFDYPQLGDDLVRILRDCVEALEARANNDPFVPSKIFETKEWREKVDVGLHAVDILRNLTCYDPTSRSNHTNARKLNDKYPDAASTLVRALRIADETDDVVGLKAGCLEIMEAMIKATHIDEQYEAELVRLIWHCIGTKERSLITTSLRIMVQLSLKERTHYLRSIPPDVMARIHDLLMLGDEELNVECLDFLYHATLLEENVAEVTQGEHAVPNIAQLVRLLSFGHVRIPPPIPTVVQSPTKSRKPVPVVTPDLPQDLLEDILKLPEPQRAVWWMRGCFEANPESEITQLALWQAYQRQFTGFINAGIRPQPLLNANDFIKNVATAFSTARPQMIAGEGGQPNRFVINGIVPREEPMGLDYNVYLRCDWLLPEAGPSAIDATGSSPKMRACGNFFGNVKALFDHVRSKHTAVENPDMKDQPCMWKNCTRFPPPGTSERKVFLKHLMIHMPIKRKEPGIKTSNGASTTVTAKPSSSLPPPKKTPDTAAASSANAIPWTTEVPVKPSATGELVGVASMAAHVLKNLSKVTTEPGVSHMNMIRQDLITKISMNASLTEILTDVLSNIYDARENLTDGVQMMSVDGDN
ncbi:Chromatin structure-remodeling complex protein rsc9 [Orbilia brochopaga]|uniref:Chromatin structure-remodeling complex protein rsc9 n=1 Tax=Orbilia brochopaga TaxID=3140254 RepID=A0AAV9V5Q5_9PEZI